MKSCCLFNWSDEFFAIINPSIIYLIPFHFSLLKNKFLFCFVAVCCWAKAGMLKAYSWLYIRGSRLVCSGTILNAEDKTKSSLVQEKYPTFVLTIWARKMY